MPAAIPIAMVASAVIGGAISSDSQRHAANTQADAQRQAARTQADMFNTINQQEQPFIQTGYGANKALNQLMGLGTGTDYTGGLPNGYLNQTFNPTQDQLNNYPGYKFALEAGGQAVRNAATPGVGALSGAALKDLMNFNVGTANQYYGQYFNQDQMQKQNIFSRLSGLAGLGQNAATQVGTQGTALGTGIAQAQAGAGASVAAGQLGAGNAIANSIGSSGTALGYLLNNPGASNGVSATTSGIETQANPGMITGGGT